MKKHMANIITVCRILCSVVLLLFPVSSAGFFAAYLICGFSDMVDGTIARKISGTSRFGAKLDSVADLMFVSAAAVRLLPVIHLPGWLWIWIIVIAVIKAGTMVWGFLRGKKWTLLHTAANKITGLLLFLLPLTLDSIDVRYRAAAVCFVATFAAIQEGYLVATGREDSFS